MKIEWDKPIEVTKSQYEKAMVDFSTLIAGRKEGGKFYIKLWFMQYKTRLAILLHNTK